MSVCQRRSGHLHIYLHTIHVSTIKTTFSFSQPKDYFCFHQIIFQLVSHSFSTTILDFLTIGATRTSNYLEKKTRQAVFSRRRGQVFHHASRWVVEKKAELFAFWEFLPMKFVGAGKEAFQLSTPQERRPEKRLDLTSLSGIPMMMDVLTREVVTQLMLPVAMLMAKASRFG